MTKKIPILDLKGQIKPIRRELDSVMKKVVDNANFVFGNEIKDFEDAVTKYCQVKYALGVSSGTDAIRLALLSAGVKPQDAVLCPAFTYYATAGSIATIGAVPVFTDIDPATYNVSPLSIEEVIKKKRNLKIKAIVPVHLYGQCADMTSILKIARRYNLKVIEDTAQAFGAEYRGRKAGTIGDCGAVSFFPGKNLGAFGDAGMILTNNKIIADRIKILRNQGNIEKYHHMLLGYNNRMDTFQAAVLKVKLKYLDSWNKKRQENAEYFNQRLQDLDINTPFIGKYNTHIYHQYVLRLSCPSRKLVKYLKKKSIDARVYYPLPLHLQRCFKYLGYKRGDFPESEKAAKETLAIPVYPDLTREEMDYIVDSIRGFLHA